MDIKFYRGDNHKTRFKFNNLTKEIEKIYFTVKCINKYPKIQKQLGNGITLGEDGYYCIEFLPEDTDKLSCDLEMVYDIEIIYVGGEKKTAIKGKFILEEDVTTPDCEG